MLPIATFIILQTLVSVQAAPRGEQDYKLVGGVLFARHDNKNPGHFLQLAQSYLGFDLIDGPLKRIKDERDPTLRMRTLGRLIYEKYSPAFDSLQPGQRRMLVTHSDRQRTEDSAQNVTIGFNGAANVELAKERLNKNDKATVLPFEPEFCPRFTSELKTLRNERPHPAIEEMKDYVRLKVLPRTLPEGKTAHTFTEKDMNMKRIVGLPLTMLDEGLEIPKWARDEDFLTELLPRYWQSLWLTYTQTTALMQAIVGAILEPAVAVMKNIMKNDANSHFLHMHVGHEVTTFAITAILDPRLATDRRIILKVGFGATLSIDIFKNEKNGNYFVKARYASKAEEYPTSQEVAIEGCGRAYCPIEKLLTLFEKFVPADFGKLCSSTPFDVTPSIRNPSEKDEFLFSLPSGIETQNTKKYMKTKYQSLVMQTDSQSGSSKLGKSAPGDISQKPPKETGSKRIAQGSPDRLQRGSSSQKSTKGDGTVGGDSGGVVVRGGSSKKPALEASGSKEEPLAISQIKPSESSRRSTRSGTQTSRESGSEMSVGGKTEKSAHKVSRSKAEQKASDSKNPPKGSVSKTASERDKANRQAAE